MPIITCPECKKDMSDTLNSCPHCGFKIIKINPDEKQTPDISNLKSMIKCDCGNVYSIYTKTCPLCNKTNESRKRIPFLRIAIAIIVILLGFLIFYDHKSYDDLNVTVVSPKDIVPTENLKKIYKIGDRGPAGGWVFYDKGTLKNGWRYLEAAASDLPRKNTQWYANYDEYIKTGAIETAIGTGITNTKKIIQAQGNGYYAASLCVDYNGGGKKDWFLPSIEELNLMYKRLYKKGIGAFDKNGFYWSSSEHVKGYSARSLIFEDGSYYIHDKRVENDVRPIRAF